MTNDPQQDTTSETNSAGAPDRELLKGAKLPTTVLTGESEHRYVDQLLSVLQSARLNANYPDARAMRSHLRVLHPEVHRGLYEGVEMNLDSGLPSYREWTRAQTDVRLADDQLRQLGPRESLAQKASSNPESIHANQLRKFDYYRDIRHTSLVPLGDMDVKLRRVKPEANVAHFHVILDKLDASGLFVRFSIDLAQENSAWSDRVVELDDETARHTEQFQSLIYKFTSLDAEFTFAKLAGLGGLEVESVTKGTVGPIFFASEQAPAGLRHLFERPEDIVATFSLDKVSRDISESNDNDPLEPTMFERLSDEARHIYEKARQQYDYRAFHNRKFVVPADRVESLRTWCRQQGTKNIIYELRP